MHFWPKYYRSNAVPFFSASCQGYMMSICLITGEVHFDHLVKVVSAVFFHWKVTIFSSFSDKYLGEILWGLHKCPISSQTFALILTSIGGSCLQQ